MYIVLTRVKLLPDTHEACAELFRNTNPALVKDEPDWLGARLMFDVETNVVTVLATWRDVQSYRRLSASHEFQNAMQKFGKLFAAPPEISVNNLLVDMRP